MFYVWLLLSVVLMFLEVILGLTVVLFFASLGALSVALFVFLDIVVSENITLQAAIFCISTISWALILWKPFKYLLKKIKRSKEKYKNIEGQIITVISGNIDESQIGEGVWSGTVVRIKLIKGPAVKQGDEVVVANVEGNIFEVYRR